MTSILIDKTNCYSFDENRDSKTRSITEIKERHFFADL